MTADFRRLAIVNRGEAAMRLLNAVAEYNRQTDAGLETIALYTDPDASAWFVREADEAVSLGPATYVDDAGKRKVSYLDYERLEDALVRTGAEAVWVGWGFVAEHADFADLCARNGITFIGPPGDVMRGLGDKIASKQLAEESGVPVVPWGGAAADTLDDLRRQADALGFPLMIKASAGGGGRGIRSVASAADLESAYESARNEAAHAFGDPRVFIEKQLVAARHIEVQVIADGFGNAWGVGVRDCSVQRRHQKVLEESASTALDAAGDEALRDAAVRLCLAAGYQNAGTVEFLYDPDSAEFYFMEVNARLQVEHPVTELTTGLDLVKLQLDVARGGKLEGEMPATSRHAIEARLNAEDPDRDFAPAPGRVSYFRPPAGPGVRVDTGIAEGDSIAAEFDSMVAKIIAWGHDRAEALARLRRAIAQCRVVVDGGTTNKAFLLELLDRPEIIAGDYDNAWLDRLTAAGVRTKRPDAQIALLMAAIEAYDAETAIQQAHFFATAARGRPEVPEEIGQRIEFRYLGLTYELSVYRIAEKRYRVDTGERRIEIDLERLGSYERRLTILGSRWRIVSVVQGPTHLIEVEGIPYTVERDTGGVVRAASPGVVISIDVSPGDDVSGGDRLLVVESMKMETSVVAPFAGRVRAIEVAENVQVDAGAVLLRIEPAREAAPETSERVAFDVGEDRAETDKPAAVRCKAVFDSLRSELLGYDTDRNDAARIAEGQRVHCVDLPADHPALLRNEEEILEIFADICALSRRQPDIDSIETDDEHARSAQEYLFTFLRSLEASRQVLPSKFLDRIAQVLARYGVDGFDRTPELEESLYWMYRAVSRRAYLVPSITAILDRRLDARAVLADEATDDFRDLLVRVVNATEGRIPEVSDLARDVLFQYYDAPVLAAARDAKYGEMETVLARLAEVPPATERRELIDALVSCPQPLHPLLIEWMPRADMQAVAVEVMVRRYYRIRVLEDLATDDDCDCAVAHAEYDYAGARNHLLATYAGYDDFDSAVEVVRDQIAGVPDDVRILVDLYLFAPKGRDLDLGDDALKEAIRLRLDPLAHGRHLHRVVVTFTRTAMSTKSSATSVFTFRHSDGAFVEDEIYRNLHPMLSKRLELWRLENFAVERLPSTTDVYLFRAVAHENSKDERLFALAEVRDLTPVLDDYGRVVALPHFERSLMECLSAIRGVQSHRPPRSRPFWNRVILYLRPPLELTAEQWRPIVSKLAPATRGLGLEKVVVRGRILDEAEGEAIDTVLHIANPGGRDVVIRRDEPRDRAIRPLSEYRQKVVKMQRRGLVYPYELIRLLTPDVETESRFPPGEFSEHDLDESGELVPVDRAPGKNAANLVVGLISNTTQKQPHGMTRVAILGDPSRSLGSLAEPECRRIIAAIDLAETLGVPVEWFALSSGAKISMESGTENMDWIGAVLRCIVTFTQAGGEINVIVTGINVGAQPYWNAEATMLMHTRGILVMVPQSAMVLTGKQALDFSGGVSAEDNLGIGGFERVMGPNGQAQYWAPDLDGACEILFRHYEHTFVVPGERFPRRAPTTDPRDRDVRSAQLASIGDSDLATVGDIFSEDKNADRKKAFDVRSVMRAVADEDQEPLERWTRMRHAETAVVWDAHVGGIPVCMLGLESQQLPRRGFVPADGPAKWTSGTLFPQSSKKVARALNAASGNRPVVVLANLSGFDGSPESMRLLQLEFGAEIGRAVVNFDGPIVFCVISRYHGGAFVVFAKTLNESLEVAAVEGSFASVIGGAPAAAVVFARDVDTRTRSDPRVSELEDLLARSDDGDRAQLRARYDDVYQQVRTEKLGEVADEFSSVHSVHRAREVGSVDEIIEGTRLRAYLVDALERGIALTPPAETD